MTDHLDDARELDVTGMVKGQCHALYHIFREDFLHYVCLGHIISIFWSECSSLALSLYSVYYNVKLPIPRCTATARMELLWTFMLPVRHLKFKTLNLHDQ
jgi:hypothetical protein